MELFSDRRHSTIARWQGPQHQRFVQTLLTENLSTMITRSMKRSGSDGLNTAAATRSRPTAPPGYEKEQAKYPELFNSRGISRSDVQALQFLFRRYPNVGQDCYATVTVANDDPATWALTSDAFGPCVAVCARGTNKNGETVLYLAHHSDLSSYGIDHALKQLMIEGCNPRDVSVYILGGEAAKVNAQGEAEDLSEHAEFLDAVTAYPQLKGLKLPIMPYSPDMENPNPSTAVVLTREGPVLFCSSDDLPKEGRDISEGSGLTRITDAQFEIISALSEGRFVDSASESETDSEPEMEPEPEASPPPEMAAAPEIEEAFSSLSVAVSDGEISSEEAALINDDVRLWLNDIRREVDGIHAVPLKGSR